MLSRLYLGVKMMPWVILEKTNQNRTYSNLRISITTETGYEHRFGTNLMCVDETVPRPRQDIKYVQLEQNDLGIHENSAGDHAPYLSTTYV